MFPGFNTRHQHGRECVRLPTACIWNRCCVVANDSGTAQCAHDVPTVVDLFNSADDDFFHRVQTNSHHVLQPYLPDQIDIPYELRTRSHINMNLINKTKFLSDEDFLIRMLGLYKYSY